ncbi:MAG: hypothetical protein ACFFDU_04410 [Candidatus Thorarchaeota archaeon]
MKAEELLVKYQELTATPLDSPSIENESGESVAALYQSSSLRILLIRTLENPDITSIEVEVWLPTMNSNHDSAKSEDELLGEVLSKMIEHLSYLLKLHQSGFILDVIKNDCLWTASKAFKKPPSHEIFNLLLPP